MENMQAQTAELRIWHESKFFFLVANLEAFLEKVVFIHIKSAPPLFVVAICRRMQIRKY